MKTIVLMVTLAVTVSSASAFASDPIPFFKPDPKPIAYGPMPAHPIATDCAINDLRCIADHDALVRDMAIAAGDRDGCADATDLFACLAVVDMVAGEVELPANPILADPCAVVVSVAGPVAVVASKRLGVTRRTIDRGWRVGQFIGKCIPPAPLAVPMPSWAKKGKTK